MAAVLFAVVVDIVIVAAMVDVRDAVLTRTSTTSCLAGNKQQPPLRVCLYRDATVHRRPGYLFIPSGITSSDGHTTRGAASPSSGDPHLHPPPWNKQIRN
jgi:hypothetical protein